MARTALVIHADAGLRRMIGDGLLLFRPGFRVSTAPDLDAASELLSVLHPDVIVMQGTIAPPDVIDNWAASHSVDRYPVILTGDIDAQLGARAAAILPDSLTLPDLLNAVRHLDDVIRVPREARPAHSGDADQR